MTRAHPIVLSAATEQELAAARSALVGQLVDQPRTSMAQLSDRLAKQVRPRPHRLFAMCTDAEDAGLVLGSGTHRRLIVAEAPAAPVPVVFMFPGHGAQHVGMGRQLHERSGQFREQLDPLLDQAGSALGTDMHAAIFDGAADGLADVAVTQVALLAVEYAVAGQWLRWGVRPAGVVGHSLGAYCAAAVAGVFTPQAALDLVGTRGRLLRDIAPGAMLGVRCAEADLVPLLSDGVGIAAVNGPEQLTVTGAAEPLRRLAEVLTARGIDARPVHATVAGHSPSVDPILPRFGRAVAVLPRREPTIPFVSETTGDYVLPGQLTDPAYWVGHMRHAVRFGDAVAAVLARVAPLFLEVGPGMTLTTLVRRCPGVTRDRVVNSLPHPRDEQTGDLDHMTVAAGTLWTHGATVSWPDVGATH